MLNDCVVVDILWDKKNYSYYKIILLKGKIREDGWGMKIQGKWLNSLGKTWVFLSEICCVVKDRTTVVEESERDSHSREFGVKITGTAEQYIRL